MSEATTPPPDTRPPATVGDRLVLAVQVWAHYAWVVVQLRRRPLPEVVARAGAVRRSRRHDPVPRLSRATDRCLRVGPFEARCLTATLVLHRLLRARGHHGEVVIGLPPEARDHRAHSWVELDGRVVGPPPGRSGHRELVRYGT